MADNAPDPFHWMDVTAGSLWDLDLDFDLA